MLFNRVGGEKDVEGVKCWIPRRNMIVMPRAGVVVVHRKRIKKENNIL